MQDYYPSRGEREAVIDRVDPVVWGEGSGEHALSDAAIRQYARDGFIVLDSFFDAEELGELREAVRELEGNATLRQCEECVNEPDSGALRSIFSQHLFSKRFNALMRDRRILDKVEQILGSEVYLHHSRINIKPAYKGKSFPWHSDFETWHAEDGLPRCRCVTAWVMLTDNTPFNGPLYLVPGSQKRFISCRGRTPAEHYKTSLKHQRYGVPSLDAVRELTRETPLAAAIGKAGTLVLHDGNVMHGSPDNISPDPRTNAFFVYNSVRNLPEAPFASSQPRAPFLCLNDHAPL